MTGQAKVQLILELKNRLNTGLTEAKKRLNGTVEGMKDKINSLKITHTKAFSSMIEEVPMLGRAVSLLGNPYALVVAGLLAVGAAGISAAKWSNQWAGNLAKVNVTAQLSRGELKRLDNQLVDIGTRNIAPLEQIPEAFNRIISAGLDVNTSLRVLEPTLRAAKAGFADIETVAAAGVGVMASSGQDITRVYDILFATLNKGNAEFQDVAQYLPKIIPLARGAGFALDETAASWAYLTAQGFKAEQATTGIMNLFKSLTNVDIVKGFKANGIAIYDAKGKIKPLVDIIDQLNKKMNGLSDQKRSSLLDAIGLRDMESKGAILSMIQDVKKLKSITDFTINSQGQLNEAYQNAKQPLDDWSIILNRLKGNVVKPFGDFFLNIFGKIGTAILSGLSAFKEWYNSSILLQDLLSGLSFVIKWSIIKPLEGVWWLIKQIWAGVSFVIKNIAQAFEWLYRTIKPVFIWLDEALIRIFNIFKAIFNGDFSGGWQQLKDFKMPTMQEIRKKMEVEYSTKNKSKDNPFSSDGNVPGSPDPEPDGNSSNYGVEKITSAAQTPRVINIQIGSFNSGGIHVNSSKVQNMSEGEMEKYFEEMWLRLLANIESSYQ